MINKTGLIIALFVFIIFFCFLLWVNVRYKKFLDKQVPVAHIKEKIFSTDVSIKCDIGAIIVFCIGLIVVVLI